jgi:hypothetical protein
MASIITATVSSGLTQQADNSGVLQLASGTGNLVTVPSVTGTAMVSGNMPAFRAEPSTNQSVTSGTYTKVDFATEIFDTNSNFASSRFTPTVAGYYFISSAVYAVFSSSGSYIWALIYKNGTRDIPGNLNVPVTATDGVGIVNGLVYMNGTTDYVEIYCLLIGTSPSVSTTINTQFSGFLARTA